MREVVKNRLDELLDREIFTTLEEAKVRIESN